MKSFCQNLTSGQPRKDPELYDGVRVRHVFLFGKQDIGPIQKEIDRFGDALVGDFIDSFHNLTFKDAMLLQWAQDSCHARFILKGDDDVFVSLLYFIEIFTYFLTIVR